MEGAVSWENCNRVLSQRYYVEKAPSVPSLNLDEVNESQQFVLACSYEGDILTNLKHNEEAIKQLFCLQGSLSFEKLPGPSNAPVHVFQSEGDSRRSLGVFKRENDASLAEYRMRALVEMKEKGYKHLPEIIKNRNGEYITKLGDTYYSVIEYLEQDINHKERLLKFSFEEMISFVKEFHIHSKESSFTKHLAKNTLDRCLSHIVYFSDKQLKNCISDLCSTESWNQIEQLNNYFGSSFFQDIYLNMPTALIHGDNHLGNIVFSHANLYFIDFDAIKCDIRLWDFALYCGKRFVNEYLILLKDKKLFSLIESHYMPLTTIEKEHFHDIILLRKIYLIGRYLQILKDAFARGDVERLDFLRSKIFNTIQELNDLCKAVPHPAIF